MFQRYTEKARRTIFFARYEASQFGSPYIESEHLLLGLLREDKALTNRFLRNSVAVEDIRKQIDDATIKREKVSTSVDLPLSNENKRVLAYAAEEAERLSHKNIGTEHLLLGLLREEKSFAAQLLNNRGLRISGVREALAQSPHEGEGPGLASGGVSRKGPGLPSDFSTYLTKLAKEGRLPPCVGREKEIEQVMHVLSRSSKNNVVLVGEPGVGKRTIAEGVVQRVAENAGPVLLHDKLFAAIDLASLVALAQRVGRSKEYLDLANAEMINWGAGTIFVFDELHALLAHGEKGGAQEVTLLLKQALLDGKVRCIALATPDDYQAATKTAQWLDRCFRAVKVEPPSEDDALKILESVKEKLEKFHSVRYSDESLSAAVRFSSRFIKDRSLPDKAIDLLDDAGAYLKTKHAGSIPPEIVEAGKKLASTVRTIENAIANHQFEIARFHSDEERKQRDDLQRLQNEFNIKIGDAGVVTADHVEEALARTMGVTVAAIREASKTEASKETDVPQTQSKKRARKK